MNDPIICEMHEKLIEQGVDLATTVDVLVYHDGAPRYVLCFHHKLPLEKDDWATLDAKGYAVKWDKKDGLHARLGVVMGADCEHRK